jgi:hypothetical protein
MKRAARRNAKVSLIGWWPITDSAADRPVQIRRQMVLLLVL